MSCEMDPGRQYHCVDTNTELAKKQLSKGSMCGKMMRMLRRMQLMTRMTTSNGGRRRRQAQICSVRAQQSAGPVLYSRHALKHPEAMG